MRPLVPSPVGTPDRRVTVVPPAVPALVDVNDYEKVGEAWGGELGTRPAGGCPSSARLGVDAYMPGRSRRAASWRCRFAMNQVASRTARTR